MISNVDSYIMPTYGKRKLEFISGKGVYLLSSENKKYLDFGSGISVNSLGHCHPSLVKALKNQSTKLWHTSNLYLNKKQENYAKLLCNYSFAEKVFFTNSGTESVECGIKVIKSYHNHHKNINKTKIITFDGAFHGRTFGSLSAQKNNIYSKVFKPLLPGFIKIPFNNIMALKKNMNENIAGVIIEPIQGEGGIRPVTIKYLEELKKICDQHKALLFLDEVQTGFGRSGKLFSYQWSNIEPDLMAVAKGIGSGFPMGACLTTKSASIGMQKGVHGSTFGGNPLAISVGTAVINEIMSKNFLSQVNQVSKYLWDELIKLKKDFNEITEIRGAGLLIGIKTKKENYKISNLLSNNGLLTVTASDNILRLAPPLIIKKKDVDKAIIIIRKVLQELND